ncbi:DUF1850 domain-containing protein [Bacillus sp. FJAT-47783]|uniref:DUF1850 domain-containing protein n=1 Tax=Bacillus sp. FJAT-47783 TaxID=2922712 RepID=UPI001FAC2E77|nr:DUF1850 domain-containing protein [Bacillus sp. FJAT-47783]
MLRKYKRFFILPLLLLLIAFVFFFPYKQTIAFYFEDTNQLLLFLPLKESDTFQIEYTHSIHLSDVIETYKIENEKLVQTQLEYEDFAIGMPSNAEGNERFDKKNGKYVISNMDRHFQTLDLRIGQVRADHKLIYDEKKYKLTKWIDGGTWVRIIPARLNLWQQLKGVNISE